MSAPMWMARRLAMLWFHEGDRSKEPESLRKVLRDAGPICGEVYIDAVRRWLEPRLAAHDALVEALSEVVRTAATDVTADGWATVVDGRAIAKARVALKLADKE